jgi:hypothetical protein
MIGADLRVFREARRLRQDDIARATRQAGLPWTRSIIVALEAGRRELSVDEFTRLPGILERLGVGTVAVKMSSANNVACVWIADLYHEETLTAPWAGSLAASQRVTHAMAVAFPWTRGDTELLPAYEAAGSDLEQKVARRVGLDPLIVALIAQATWGQSLSAKRDQRVANEAPAGTTPRAMQALRAHATRALLEELSPMLDEARKRSRRQSRRHQ